MPWPAKSIHPVRSSDEPGAVFDDGGTGLLEAARRRFAPRGCEISCDAKHTVWVKSVDGRLSLGLPRWKVGRQSVEHLLDSVEERLDRL